MTGKITKKIEQIKEGSVEFFTIVFGLIVLSKLLGKIIGLFVFFLVLSMLLL